MMIYERGHARTGSSACSQVSQAATTCVGSILPKRPQQCQLQEDSVTGSVAVSTKLSSTCTLLAWNSSAAGVVDPINFKVQSTMNEDR